LLKPGPGWHLAPVIAEGDCDDFNGAFNAGAIDVCNGIDDNCNGIIDDAFTSGIAQFAYYPTTDSAFVRVLNLTTQSIVATIPVGQYPVAASANPEGTKVYIANKNSNTISVIDVATQTVSTTIPVGNAPVDVEVSRDGTKVYVANSVSNTISVINANTNTVSNTINLANQPKYLELHPGGNKLYISTNVGITIANITNNTILSNIQISNATNIVFTNDGSKGYLASGGFAIVINPIVDTISYLPGSTYGFDYQCIGLSQDNHYLFVSAKTSIAPFARYNLLTLTWDINLGGSNEPYFANSGIVHNVNLGLDYVLLAGRLKIIQANSLTTIQTIPMFNPNPNQNVNPYVLINGSFIAFLHPEINLKGGWPSTSILDGDNSPSLSDYTDFGNINTTGFSYKTYRIENNGLAPLHICNISLSGPHASMFTLGPLPSTIPVGGVDSLTVYFYPSSPGIKSATVTIINNDLTEGVFNFSIQGTGTLPKLAYITHSSANTVGVYDINSYTHLQDINVGAYPNGLALNPSKNKLYVTNSNANTVSVINTFSNQVIASVAVGNNPVGVCVSPNGNKIYVANKNSNTISVIDALTNSIVSTINVGTAPTGICILPDSSKVYVTNNGSNTISIINTTTNSVTATLAVGIAPYGITPSSDGTKVYIANSGSNTVSVLNTSNNSFSIPYTTGGYPYSIAVNSSGSTIYVSNYTDFTVSAINTLMGFSNTVPVGNYPAGMSFSEDESQLFVSCYGNDTMTVINTMMNFVSNSFTTGSGPLSFGNSVGTIPVPQIEVKGGGLLLPITIENYDYTPSTGDNTDFGQVNGGNSLTHTFYIQNLGNTELNISNVEMYGPDTSMFYFGNIPTSVAPNATDSFTITFTPTALGIKTAYIHISSNVPNLGNYYYGVQGEGVGSFTTTFNLKLFIEGYYSGGGLMQPVLFNAGASLMNTSCDSITIELHDPFTFNTIFTNRVMLNTSGIATVNYPHSISGGNYYIVVRTRNTIETWSKLPVTFNSSSVFFDFSSQ
jgi:YVTN family beta-propeller protein